MSENVHITKLEAARRQLCAAVRFLIHGEDELAVHTVTAAAAGIISDLRGQRGHDEAGEATLGVLYGLIGMYRSGDIPKSIAEDPKSMAYIRELLDLFPTITADSTWHDFRALVGEVSMPPESVSVYWKDRSRIANFLKHADRDSGAHINECEIDNLHFLMNTVVSYQELMPIGLMAETYVLMIYAALADGNRVGLSGDDHKLLETAEQLSNDELVEFFDLLLATMKEHHGEA